MGDLVHLPAHRDGLHFHAGDNDFQEILPAGASQIR